MSKKLIYLISFVLSLGVLQAVPAEAQSIEFEFGGIVTDVQPGLGSPWDQVDVNDQWSIVYTFDPTTTDSTPSATRGDYYFTITSYTLSIGSGIDSDLSPSGVGHISVFNNRPPAWDQYEVKISGPGGQYDWYMQLNGPNTIWGTDELPLSGDIELSDFSGTRHFRLTDWDPFGDGEINGSVDYHRFIPFEAYDPSPADDANCVGRDVVLTWSPGCLAVSHLVYFGLDPGALTLVAIKPLGQESYAPGRLELNTTYYWQINESNGVDVWESDVWSFTTGPLAGQYTLFFHEHQATMSSITVDMNGISYNTGAITFTLDLTNPLNSYEIFDFDTMTVHEEADVLVTAPLFEVFGLEPVKAHIVESGSMKILSPEGPIPAGEHRLVLETDLEATVVVPPGSIFSGWIWTNTSKQTLTTTTTVGSDGKVKVLLTWTKTFSGKGSVKALYTPAQPIIFEGEGKLESNPPCVVVDNFESYNDTNNLIYDTWVDGRVNGTGSEVGLEMETVHSGEQSMRIEYDNANPPYYSEAVYTYDIPQDWTLNAMKALELGYLIKTDNDPNLMYVAVEDTTGTIALCFRPPDPWPPEPWPPWPPKPWPPDPWPPGDYLLQVGEIDLQHFSDEGVDLRNVKKVYIGFGDRDNPEAGGSGTIYVGDIRLYPTRCFVNPVGDINGDCSVDFKDFAMMVGNWLETGLFP